MIWGEEATRKQTQAGFLIALVYGAAPCNSSRTQIIGPYTQDLVANGGPKLQRQLGAQPKKIQHLFEHALHIAYPCSHIILH